MDISLYFEPVNLDERDFTNQTDYNRLGNVTSVYATETDFPDLTDVKLVLIGVTEERAALKNKGCGKSVDEIRDYFYRLYAHWNHLNLADLGNIVIGHSINDTYFALKEVVSYLLKREILPIIIGGSQDLTYANYLAYEDLGKVINIVSIDSKFDLGHDEHELNSKSFLSRIILHQPNFLFNYTNIGYQSYFVDQDAVALMKNLYFDTNRLGNVRMDIADAEPMIRNADMLSFDITSVRQSDAPGSYYSNPNGFYGEEACRICRYAGMNDKLSSIGFYETNPKYDSLGQTAHLVAQMIWYFIDGFMNRQGDLPGLGANHYTRFMLHAGEYDEELVFLKSKKTDRWWMEIQSKFKFKNKYKRHQFVPCSYQDYQTALKHEIPDRWWKVQQKLM